MRVDALTKIRVAPSCHALGGPLITQPMVAVALGAARNHDAVGMTALERKVDE